MRSAPVGVAQFLRRLSAGDDEDVLLLQQAHYVRIALGAGGDIFAAGEEPLLEDPLVCRLGSHSSAILLLRGPNQQQGQTALEKAA